MRQAGFFDQRERQKKLLATRDFLDRVNRFMAWESFRPRFTINRFCTLGYPPKNRGVWS